MKRKNLLLSVLSLAIVAVIAIGVTLAYLTDRDSEVNTFTVGDVEIALDENFEQGSELIPGVKITKEVAIENVGDNEAWVWYTYAVPTTLINTGANASKNTIHFNIPGRNWDTYREIKNYWLEDQTEAVALENTWHWEKMDVDALEKDGVKYTVVTVLYNGTLDVGETTTLGLEQVYLDTHVDIAPNGDWYWIDNGVATALNWNSNTNGNPYIYVSAYAIQADEFKNVNDAYAAYNKQWGDNGTEYADPSAVPVGFQVNNSEELAEAIANGETKIWLNAGTYKAPAAAQGKTLTLGGTRDAILEVQPTPGASEGGGQLDYSFDGSKVTFNGITIKTNSQTYAGYARLSGTYNNCVIQNTYNLGTGDSAFYNCEINITNEYLRVNGAYTAIFDGCTFNTDGRAILVFQDGTSVAQTVTVKDCTFNATAAAKTWNGIHVAAVSIDGTNGTYVVNLEGNNIVDSDFNGLWQIKTGEANVTVKE